MVLLMAEFKRYVGYENADVFRSFLIDSFVAVQKNGLFFRDKLPMATTTEITAAAAYTAADMDDAASVKQGLDSWLNSQRIQCDSAAVSKILAEGIQKCGTNKKNTYFVLLCWLIKYLGAKPQKLFYIGAATMRELYFLHMMQLAGVEVIYVSYGEDSDFLNFPYKDKITNVLGPKNVKIQIDFATLDLSKERQLSDMRAAAEKYEGAVTRIDTSAAGIFEDFIVPHQTRVIKRGGVYTDGCEIPVYFAALVGFDEEAVYTNMLLKFKESFSGLKKQLIFIEKTLDNPNADEVKALGNIPRGNVKEMIDAMALLIKLNGDPLRTALAQKALREMLNELYTGNPTVIINYGNKLITWLYRCTQARKYAVQYEDIPTVLYYGDISQSEIYFLHFMSRCGFDVIYITPNKSNLDPIVDKNPNGRMQIFQLPQTKASGKYPDKPIKMKVSTVAYSAERELDTMLYNGDAGLFRSFQFPNSQSVTLRTTFEEIGILWKHESKFRTGFEVNGNLVSVPNIFAKISGVKDGNVNDYWDEIRDRLTPETVIYIKEAKPNPDGALDLSVYRSYYRNGQIDLEKLKASNLNKYSYLPDRTQDFIFYKLQEAVESGFLKLQGDDLMCAVIHYGLSLGKDLLQILQRFDFTKQIPKIIYIDAVEETFSVEECVRLVLFNLFGFDILIYTPTGYKNLETYVTAEAFEEHTMNEFMYNLEVPKFKIPSDDKNSGFFGKLFRKG